MQDGFALTFTRVSVYFSLDQQTLGFFLKRDFALKLSLLNLYGFATSKTDVIQLR